jgi:thioesterase domain-containing protein
MPIGRPIRNLRLHILDGHLNPLPAGVPGELYVGGIGVGRGYAGQAGRTASAFMPDPFAAEPGARLYRTGDRCRYRENGLIEYLERVDEQVKLRGFRIEPGEIQARLEEHPKVSRALVTTDTGSEGGSRLIAYVTGDLERGDEAELRRHLRTSLPDYMIPAVFVRLSVFPLNANGKIDRAALPGLQIWESALDSEQLPRNPLETLLAQLWAEVLDLPRVGREQDFFQLGGHSLLAVRLVQQIRHSVRPDCPLSAVFHAPSVARMAEWLQHGQVIPISPLVLLNAHCNAVPLFCIHPAGGHVLEYRALADFLEGRHPVYGIQARSLGDPQESPDSIEALAEDYVEVLLKAGHDDPFHLLGWSMGGSIALAIAARLESAGREVAFLGLVDTWRQVDTDEFDDWVRHFADFLSGEDLVRLEQLDPDERESLVRSVNQPDLSPIERLEAAAHFGQSRDYWLQGVAMDLIRAQYLEDQHSTAMIRAFTPAPVKAPLSLWWAEASLDGRGRTPGNWNDVALGGCRTRVVATDHKTIVRHPQIHAEIAEALRELAATGRDATS